MEAGNIHVAEWLNTAYQWHEIGSVVHSHHVYKSVWLPVIEQLILEKEPAGQFTQWICNGIMIAVMKDSQIMGWTLSENVEGGKGKA